MTVATFKDLCLDAVDGDVVGSFWAAALGEELERRSDNVAVIRHPLLHALWINTVAESKLVKNRVHLDLYGRSVQALTDLGAVLVAMREGYAVLQDPEGNETCVFPGDGGGALVQPFALCVDSDQPSEAARWWQSVLGGTIGPGPDGDLRYVHGAAGMGELILKFVPVADERVVKNRCHWDVTTDDVTELMAAGAAVQRTRGDDINWTVMVDPQGNEFCAFMGR